MKSAPQDNVLVALRNLKIGGVVYYNGEAFTLQDDVKAKPKYSPETRRLALVSLKKI